MKVRLINNKVINHSTLIYSNLTNTTEVKMMIMKITISVSCRECVCVVANNSISASNRADTR